MTINFQDALARAVREAKAPGAVACVGGPAGLLFQGATGFREITPLRLPAETSTLYDLASLTKVIATTTAVMLLRDDGALDLDQPANELLPIPEFSRFTLRNLLTHTAGLAPSGIWYREVNTLNEVLQRVAVSGFDWLPGASRHYSDLGFMILGKIVELTARDSLDAFCARRIFTPLGMSRTMFNPPEALRAECAATERCPWRGRVLIGEVHDENASAIGGVSGHAGLFAPASDIALFCQALLGHKLLKASTIEEMTRLGQLPSYPWQGLGWKIDPWSDGSEGFLLSRKAFGHTGWTGTSLWMDQASGLFCILLSNTPHPNRAARQNRTLRTLFHEAVCAKHYPKSTNVHTGLDRIVWDGFDVLKGKRVAVLTHHAATDQLGRPLLDVLALESQIQVRRIYSPEHGLRGSAEAGASVASERGAVPLISLYGDRKRPSLDELREIDLFVADLQDVGARYYTYAATLKECMAACADAGVPMLVLDRPNPVGGAIIEGPIAENVGALVCSAAVPVRHGLTLGELALFFLQTTFKGAKLQVAISPMDNWWRDQQFNETSLPWKAPSPNIPSPEIALLYTGMCLFEGTNLNEGRGTDEAFHLTGAPWLVPEDVIAAIGSEDIPGCTLDAVTYTPRSIPGKASSPRFEGQACRGIWISVTDQDTLRPFSVALHLLRAIMRRHPEQFEFSSFFDTLAGGPALRTLLVSDTPVAQYLASLAPTLAAFDASRPKRYTMRTTAS